MRINLPAHPHSFSLSKSLMVILTVVLSGCGTHGDADSPYSDSSDAFDVSLSSVSSSSVAVKSNGSPQNLIDTTARWTTWSGSPADIRFDASTQTLRLPAPQTDLTIGVQRYDTPLVAGVTYELGVASNSDTAAALLFLFDANSRVIAPNSATANTISARNGQPFRFSAPAGVAGFFVQIQSAWQANSSTELSASLTRHGQDNEPNTELGSTIESNAVRGNNLVRIQGDWPDWAGQFQGVTASTSGTQLFVPPSVEQQLIRGVRNFDIALQPGVTYRWRFGASVGEHSKPSALLFLLNEQGNAVGFVDARTGQSQPWLSAVAGQFADFVVPESVVGFAVQVQSGYGAGQRAIVKPSLRRLGSGNVASPALLANLTELIKLSATDGLQSYQMPDGSDLSQIPQSPSNVLTPAKVELGARLFHETGLATAGRNADFSGTYSCASCHHVAAGFKAGVPQGIGEGGVGFGNVGEGRRMSALADPNAPADHAQLPDIQPLASPAALNAAYQSVMLWNGQFGNAPGDPINADVDHARLLTPETPKTANARELPGLETQAIAGLGVHRLQVTENSVLQTNSMYQTMFDAAYPDGSSDPLGDAGNAIAAYERTLLANQAPFQRWLRGDASALTSRQVRGATLFFDKAGCVACHRGPALSSPLGSTASEIFFAVGFADFDLSDPLIHGTVSSADSRGRGGFTGKASDDYQFKVPQLYNLADTDVFGHGASFQSVREVVEYKNRANPQQIAATANLDRRFVPLGLSNREVDDLVAFILEGLYDPNLIRYVPVTVPSGNCFPVNDPLSQEHLGCEAN